MQLKIDKKRSTNTTTIFKYILSFHIYTHINILVYALVSSYNCSCEHPQIVQLFEIQNKKNGKENELKAQQMSAKVLIFTHVVRIHTFPSAFTLTMCRRTCVCV